MISKIVKYSGNRMFEIDGKLYTPAAFRSFRPTPANISLFYRNGIRLFQFQCSGLNSNLDIPYSNFGGAWVGDHQYDFTVLDRQIEMFMRFSPKVFCSWSSLTRRHGGLKKTSRGGIQRLFKNFLIFRLST